jgi:hypothetical protein
LPLASVFWASRTIAFPVDLCITAKPKNLMIQVTLLWPEAVREKKAAAHKSWAFYADLL